MSFLSKQINSRQAVYEVAEGETYFDIQELERLDGALDCIPLQTLPSSLVTPIMVLSATIRQYRGKIEQVLRVHRTMDARAFEDFFGTLEEMERSLAATCKDIEGEVLRMSSEQA